MEKRVKNKVDQRQAREDQTEVGRTVCLKIRLGPMLLGKFFDQGQ